MEHVDAAPDDGEPVDLDGMRARHPPVLPQGAAVRFLGTSEGYPFGGRGATGKGVTEMPDERPSVRNEKQYEALKEKGMSKERPARIANSPDASRHGGEKSGSGGRSAPGRHHRAEERRPRVAEGGRATARRPA